MEHCVIRLVLVQEIEAEAIRKPRDFLSKGDDLVYEPQSPRCPRTSNDILRLRGQRGKILLSPKEIYIETPLAVGRVVINSGLLPEIGRILAGKHADNRAIVSQGRAAAPILQQTEKVFHAAAVIGTVDGRNNAFKTCGIDTSGNRRATAKGSA